MTLRRHRTDANSKEIAGYFERLGCMVHRTNSTWDLTVTKHGQVSLIEVRDPKAPDQKRRNKGNDLIDAGWPIYRVKNLDDVMAVCDKLRRIAMNHDGVTEGGS